MLMIGDHPTIGILEEYFAINKIIVWTILINSLGGKKLRSYQAYDARFFQNTDFLMSVVCVSYCALICYDPNIKIFGGSINNT